MATRLKEALELDLWACYICNCYSQRHGLIHVSGSQQWDMRPSDFLCSLEWRHNGRDCVSKHQPHDCLLNRLFRPSKLRVTGICVGNSPVTGEFPARASNAENVSIWWRHHVYPISLSWIGTYEFRECCAIYIYISFKQINIFCDGNKTKLTISTVIVLGGNGTAAYCLSDIATRACCWRGGSDCMWNDIRDGYGANILFNRFYEFLSRRQWRRLWSNQ